MGWVVLEDLKKTAVAAIFAVTLAGLIAAIIPGAGADQEAVRPKSDATDSLSRG